MAIRKIEIRPPGSGDYGDVLYPKTSADIVDMIMPGEGGETLTVQQYLDVLSYVVSTLDENLEGIDQGLGTAAGKDTGTASGQVPILGSGGKLDSSILPALAITETHVVANQEAMLALTVQTGDVAVRTDLNKTFILKAEPGSSLSNWQEILTPTDLVTSVAGKTGAVTLTKSDVGLGSVENYGLATKAEAEAGSSSAKYMTPLRTKEAIDALQAVKSVAGKTGAVTLAKGDVGLGSVDNTSDANKPVSTAVQTALNGKAAASHTHTKAQITDMPTKLSQFTNDRNFISSFLTIGTVQPTNGDLWFKELD